MRIIIFILLLTFPCISMHGQGADGRSFRNYKFSGSISTDIAPFYMLKTRPLSNTLINGINLEYSPHNKFTGQLFYRYLNIKNNNFYYETAIPKDNDFLPVRYNTSYSNKIQMLGLNCRIYLVRHSYQSPWGKYLYYGINTLNFNLKPETLYYQYKEAGVMKTVNLPFSDIKKFTLYGVQLGYGRKYYFNSSEHLFLEYQCGFSLTHISTKLRGNDPIDDQIKNALLINSISNLSRKTMFLLQFSLGYSL